MTLCVLAVLMRIVLSSPVPPNKLTGYSTSSTKALKMKPPGVASQKHMKKDENVANALKDAFGFNMIIKNAVNHKIKGKKANKKQAKKHNKPTTTAALRQIPFCLPPPTPKPTKPVRFALNGKTLFSSYDWGN
jgi:hypothetical protein